MSTSSWTRAIRFIADEDGQTYYGQPDQPGDVGLLAHPSRTARLTARVLSGSPLRPDSTLSSRVLTVRQLLSPLAPSEVTAIRGLGLQYPADASRPAAAQKPPVPVLFFKPATALAGPGDEIFLPRLADGEKNDYEVELCVVMGRDCRDVSEQDAMSYVAGFCVVNDVSSRGLCGKGVQWGVGKAFDFWCPIGPALIHPSALKDPHALRITTHLNGKLVQEASTADLVLRLPELIARLSHGSTLQAGSLILTGSPVAVGRKAPGDVTDASPFLKHGDEVRCWVEGCGTLINTVREDGKPSAVQKIKAKL
ncbi:hypothetical protein JCM10207_009030 [Rhodosporidiobolus poonsookiae]